MLLSESVFFILGSVTSGTSDSGYFRRNLDCNYSSGNLARLGDVSFLPFLAELLCSGSSFAELAEVLVPRSLQFVV